MAYNINFMEKRKYYYSGSEEKYFFKIFKRVRSLSSLSSIEKFKGLRQILYGHDPISYNHSGQVANLSLYLAIEAGLAKPEYRLVYWGGWLHDMGKIFVPPDIINRETSFYLTKSQYALLITHGKKGGLISRMLNLDQAIEKIADQHWMGEDNVDPPSAELRSRHPLVTFITIADLIASAFDRSRKHQPIYTEDDVKDFMNKRFARGVFPEEIKPAFDKLMANSTYIRVMKKPMIE